MYSIHCFLLNDAGNINCLPLKEELEVVTDESDEVALDGSNNDLEDVS